MRSSFLLIHSPFLGPATWQSTAGSLRGRGRRARVPDLTSVAQAAPPYWPAGVEAIVRGAADDVDGGGPVVLVPHSNAGLLVPPVVERLGDQVRGVVFVDAALPGSGHLSTPEFLRGLAVVDGLLPGWTSWWNEADVAGLFPDAAVQATVQAEQPRMPLAYYDHLPPVSDDWSRIPCGYVWFGEPYHTVANRAAAEGWPTVHVPGRHLHMLVDPDAMAAAVLAITDAWHTDSTRARG